MDNDQDPAPSKIIQSQLSQIHGSPNYTKGELISNRSDHDEQDIDANLREETIHVKSEIDDCEEEIELEEADVVALEQKEKDKDDKKKEEEVEDKSTEEEEKKRFMYSMQLLRDLIKEMDDKKKKEEEMEKKKEEEEKKKREVEEKKKQEEEKKKKEEEEMKKEEEEKKNFIFNNQLQKDVIQNDWKSMQRAFETHKSVVTKPISYFTGTALHIAVRTGAPIQLIKNLVGLMSETDLETLDNGENTALHCAAMVGYTDAAKILVDKNRRLAKVRGLYNRTPIEMAAALGRKDTFLFLLPLTRQEDPSVFAGKSGAFILNNLIVAESYDMAIYLLKCYPSLATEKVGFEFTALAPEHHDDGFTALGILALQPHVFFGGIQLNFLQRFLYKCTHVEKVIVHHREDVENPAAETEYPLHERRETHRNFKFLQNIHDKMGIRRQALKLTTMLCAEIEKTKGLSGMLLRTPILTGARLGTHDLVSEIVKTFPDAIWYVDAIGRNIFDLAVLNRQEKVYNLMYQLSLQKHYLMSWTDNLGNTILHLAGMLGPSDRISGAAFQMQRELQWFKEVESVVPPSFKMLRNNVKRTPWEVFIEEHKDLVKKGEEWMKTTAGSCTVVAALIITVVFAAAFTLPGGNNSEGYPIFLDNLSFLIYSVSNALALCTSSTSVLMFLRILTSRYSEEDFLRALPMRLCIGLATLFLSIAFMLAAFSSALCIVLYHRLSWVAAPTIVLASVPLTMFVFLQFPLLIRMVYSTFGPSIFHQQSKEILC